MEWFVRAVLRSSVSWLAAGVTLGVAMAVHPAWSIFRPAHLHMNLLGFVAMMIFGVGYHIIPRLAGKPLHNRQMAMIHLWLANVGLLLFAPGLMLRAVAHPAASIAVALGATLSALGAYAFAWQVWLTLKETSATATRTLRVLDEHTPVTDAIARRTSPRI